VPSRSFLARILSHFAQRFNRLPSLSKRATPLVCRTSGDPDLKKRQLLAGDDQHFPLMREAEVAKLTNLAVGKLGLEASMLAWPVDLKQSRRYAYRLIGIQESYWPAALR
jgi:hypothetical protein